MMEPQRTSKLWGTIAFDLILGGLFLYAVLSDLGNLHILRFEAKWDLASNALIAVPSLAASVCLFARPRSALLLQYAQHAVLLPLVARCGLSITEFAESDGGPDKIVAAVGVVMFLLLTAGAGAASYALARREKGRKTSAVPAEPVPPGL